MGSPSDMDHCEKIKRTLKELGIPCELRVTSAHKGSAETLKILADYEGKLNLPYMLIDMECGEIWREIKGKTGEQDPIYYTIFLLKMLFWNRGWCLISQIL